MCASAGTRITISGKRELFPKPKPLVSLLRTKKRCTHSLPRARTHAFTHASQLGPPKIAACRQQSSEASVNDRLMTIIYSTSLSLALPLSGSLLPLSYQRLSFSIKLKFVL